MLKKSFDNNEYKEDIKLVKNNYKQNYLNCYEILEKIISNLTLIFRPFTNFGDFMNLLCPGEKQQNIICMNNIRDLEIYRNMFKKILGNIMIDDNISKTDMDNI